MKHTLLIVTLLVTIFSIQQTHCGKLRIFNATSHSINCHVYLSLCRDVHQWIEPNRGISLDLGLCSISRIDIDKSGTVFRGPFTGTISFNVISGGDGNPILQKI